MKIKSGLLYREAIGYSSENQDEPFNSLPDRVTSSRLLCLKYVNEMLPLCRAVMRIRNNNCEILNTVLKIRWTLDKFYHPGWEMSVFYEKNTQKKPKPKKTPKEDYNTPVLNCVIHIRENEIGMKDSFTFSPCVQSFL